MLSRPALSLSRNSSAVRFLSVKATNPNEVHVSKVVQAGIDGQTGKHALESWREGINDHGKSTLSALDFSGVIGYSFILTAIQF